TCVWDLTSFWFILIMESFYQPCIIEFIVKDGQVGTENQMVDVEVAGVDNGDSSCNNGYVHSLEVDPTINPTDCDREWLYSNFGFCDCMKLLHNENLKKKKYHWRKVVIVNCMRTTMGILLTPSISRLFLIRTRNQGYDNESNMKGKTKGHVDGRYSMIIYVWELLYGMKYYLILICQHFPLGVISKGNDNLMRPLMMHLFLLES
ncbi:hypothetical protein ACJX0J_035057, partial [Zea mays]